MKYIYPQLSLKPSQDLGFCRLGGPGLANCLFIAARAYLKAKDTGCELLRPSWERLSVGQWLRREKDKRFYYGLFKDDSFWAKLRKAWLIRFSKQVEVEAGLKNFFEDIIDRQSEVREWLLAAVNPDAIKEVPATLDKCIAVHIRLGDFPPRYRTPNAWYGAIIKSIHKAVGHTVETLVFSDGTDEELQEVLNIPGVKRVFYGNALADIVAISRCGMLIAGKYSTFSAWGAFLGKVPSIFSAIEYGRVVPDGGYDVRLGESTMVPEGFLQKIKRRLT